MPLAFGDGQSVDETERKITEDFQRFMSDGSAYQQLQSTRPQSLGYGLVDSPIALASWVLEKLWSWSDHGGDVTECFSYDQILDNIMLYWLSATGASSARLYWEIPTAGQTRPAWRRCQSQLDARSFQKNWCEHRGVGPTCNSAIFVISMS